jgi:hypothetical protein
MSRKITTYKRPSIGDLIRSAPTVDQLAQLRAGIWRRHQAGKMDASDRTLRDWAAAIWLRLLQLVAAAGTGAEATYIYNTAFRWYTDDEIRAALNTAVQRRVAAL